MLIVTRPAALMGARRIVHAELAGIDLACSRFRADSELSRLNATAGAATRVGALLAEALEVALRGGGLATSSTTVRSWPAGGTSVHHIVDPATGRPACSRWRTVSVAAGTCVDANTASTAAIIRDDRAPQWLAGLALPARLVGTDGKVVRTAGWPAEPARTSSPR
jgi:thiamine biosynthesis lipoprotein ApbE